MGYTTDFNGQFTITPNLSADHRRFLFAFSNTRRMQRDAAALVGVPDPLREVVGLPIGVEGGYFIGEEGTRFGEPRPETILDGNAPPEGQPELWCQWVPTEDGRFLQWDGGEKFYEYIEWLGYLLDHFLVPWGYVLDGDVDWFGEDHYDQGNIHLDANKLTVTPGQVMLSPYTR